MEAIINEQLKVPKNADMGAKPGGFNVLNLPDDLFKSAEQFWKEFNQPFLDKAIQRGDDFLMATDPTNIRNLFDSSGKITGFGREVKHLTESGYVYDAVSKLMVKK